MFIGKMGRNTSLTYSTFWSDHRIILNCDVQSNWTNFLAGIFIKPTERDRLNHIMYVQFIWRSAHLECRFFCLLVWDSRVCVCVCVCSLLQKVNAATVAVNWICAEFIVRIHFFFLSVDLLLFISQTRTKCKIIRRIYYVLCVYILSGI